MAQLSAKQQNVLDFIRRYTVEQGYPPSVREICDGLQLKSTSTAHGYLQRLEKRGYIRRDPSRPRAIEIIDQADMVRGVVPVSVLGSVTAGLPALAEQTYDDVFYLPTWLVEDHENSFILRIRGESMINAGINNGDHVIVERCPTANNGDIIVALIEEEATVKRFYKENGHYRLQPENDSMAPIIVDQMRVIGKVVGLIRKY